MNLIQQIEKEAMDKALSQRTVPDFRPGDTLRVSVKVKEGTRERLQAFEGVCIARKNAGINSNFTVRKISHDEGVERIFPLHSPLIAEIQVMRQGDVARAKLYYLRGRRGKSARIKERQDYVNGNAKGKKAAAKAKADAKASQTATPKKVTPPEAKAKDASKAEEAKS